MRERQKNIFNHPNRNVKCLVQTGYLKELFQAMPDSTHNELINMLEHLTREQFSDMMDSLMRDRLRMEMQEDEALYKRLKQADDDYEAEQKAKGRK